MATKKKKTVKTMDVVASRKKTKRPSSSTKKQPKKINIEEAPVEATIEESPVIISDTTCPESEPEPVEELFIDEEEYEERPMEAVEIVEEPQEEVKKVSAEPTRPEKVEAKSTSKKPLKIVSAILVIATVISVGFLVFNVARSNFLPAKFFYPSVAGLILIALIFLRFTIRRKTSVPVHIVIDFFSLAFLVASIFGNLKLNDTLTFLDKNLNGANYQTIIYDVLTGKDSKYDSKESLSGASIIAPTDFILSEDELINAVKDQVNANLTFNENNDFVTNLPLEDKDGLVLLGDAIYSSMTEANPDYGTKTKVVTTIKIEKRIDKDDNGDISEQPFLIFLSGIDAREDYIPYAARSDVNIAIAVNPKTAQILLLTIPRDYQIHVPGTSGGLNDKMTHTGSLGGVQLSKATAEDLLGVKFDDYIRVNFGFVVGLVDAIGGITINSDWNTPITCYTNRACIIQPGNNEVGGACALAFARERMAYDTGDTHRAENQQQVIGKIFEKVSKSSTIINNYSDILEALTGTFETSLTSSDIQSFVRLQLDKTPNWKIHSYTLATTGHDELYTYSYPTEPLYVAYQDPASIAKAKQMLQEILKGE